MALASVGASLTLETVRRNSSLAKAFEPSVAVTLMSIAPTSALVGVPLKVRVAVLKLSQLGSAAPLASVAVYSQRIAVGGIHVGKSVGRHREAESLILGSRLVSNGIRHRRRIVGVGHRQAELVAGEGA
jgi:hypothetical protein